MTPSARLPHHPHPDAFNDHYTLAFRITIHTHSTQDDGNMASATSHQNNTTPIAADNISDYGSDLDESAFDLLSQVESHQVKKDNLLATIEDIPLPAEHETPDQRIHVRVSRLQQGSGSWSEDLLGSQGRGLREASIEVEYDEENRGSFSRAFTYPCGQNYKRKG